MGRLSSVVPAGRLAASVVAVGVALSVAACAAPSSVPPGGTGSPGGPSAAPTAPAASGLRGERISSIQCASTRWQPDEHAAELLPSAPVRLVICPLPMPNAVHPPADLRPPPRDLLDALAEPDGPKPTASPYVCAAYADVPRLVYAQTADGAVYLLHIPVDACGHYLPSVLTVITKYAQQAPLTQ
jgi:hypothetical protein